MLLIHRAGLAIYDINHSWAVFSVQIMVHISNCFNKGGLKILTQRRLYLSFRI